MKFSLSALLVIVPLLAAQASAISLPGGGLVGRAGNNKGGGQGGKGGKGQGAATSTTSAANSSATAVAASNGTAASNSTSGGGDPQTSLTLDPSVLASGFEQDGNSPPVAGQVASDTSPNNFINFCAQSKLPITNGKQIKGGSCNPAPMGEIPSVAAMPSTKFVVPMNNQDLKANEAFTIQMAIINMETGSFANAQTNYFAAPQKLNAQGLIQGHSHVVIQKLSSVTQTTPLDPQGFDFFLGLNSAAANGLLFANVTKGLAAGAYRLSSMTTATNHQPCVVPVAQHGPMDDSVVFTVGGVGGIPAATANSTAGAAVASATSSAAPTGANGGAGGAKSVGKGGAGGAGNKGGKGQAPRFIRELY